MGVEVVLEGDPLVQRPVGVEVFDGFVLVAEQDRQLLVLVIGFAKRPRLLSGERLDGDVRGQLVRAPALSGQFLLDLEEATFIA